MTCSEIINYKNQEAEEFLTHNLLKDIIIQAAVESPIITLRKSCVLLLFLYTYLDKNCLTNTTVYITQMDTIYE